MPQVLNLDQIEDCIRKGELKRASHHLSLFAKEEVTPEIRVRFAELARRAGAPLLGIRILNPVVRPSARNQTEALPEEKAEYAAGLAQIGAYTEALELLNALDVTAFPQVALFKSFAYASYWNYADAVSALEIYIASPQLTAYQRLVGKANLAPALVFLNRYDEASKLIEELLTETNATESKLLRDYVLRIKAGLLGYLGEWNAAEKLICELEEKTKNLSEADALFFHKWKCIIGLFQSNASREAVAVWNKVRSEAVRQDHWETVRDCDFFFARCTQDKELVQRLYFGTPYDSYRTRIMEEFSNVLSIDNGYVWNRKATKNAFYQIDVSAASLNPTGARLKKGQTAHRLLCALTSDFYRPIRLATLYLNLFPGEYFNPETSPARVHQAVMRLRKWFEQNQIPLSIQEKNGMYRIEWTDSCEIFVTHMPTKLSHRSPLILKLIQSAVDGEFTTQDVAKDLNLSVRATQDLLKQAKEEELITTERRGRHYFYRLNVKRAA